MDCPVVCTKLGKIKGLALPKIACGEAKQVFCYMSLPFAKPPVGELRFEPPVKNDPWQGVLDGTKSPASPLQDTRYLDNLLQYAPIAFVGDEDPYKLNEDCLYLNVYTNNPDKAANLPVIFWIYGGAFNMGGAPGYNASALCALNDVVLVVAQYRVAVFGFFTTGRDTKCPGNMGMFDQLMALEWVRDNVSAFGGNPNNVTIFGESAGAISVNMHVISPLSRGLFHRAISSSGISTTDATMLVDQSMQRKTFLDELKITATEPDEILKELKSLESSKLVAALKANPFTTMFMPTVDGKFMPKPSEDLVQEKLFNPVPYIIGFNNSEGCALLAQSFPPGFKEGLDKQVAIYTIMAMLGMGVPAPKVEALTNAVVEFYGKEVKDDKYKWSRIVASLMADQNFIVPSITMATAYSDAGNPTYLYYMTQSIRMHHDSAYSSKVTKKPEFCEADHSDDVMFSFGYPFITHQVSTECRYSEEEKQLSGRWMKSLCRFAETGDPNSPDGSENVVWPLYDAASKQHLVLKHPYEVGSNVLESTYKFWTETVPSILRS
uniref:Carboxylic ester hydrolase n=1 Tax=Phallusia mammillata TaxID=59560 RepID=A0A6F9D9W9_9ASCI|nr:carboxylesterase 5A-like [Phallusia mammillata]